MGKRFDATAVQNYCDSMSDGFAKYAVSIDHAQLSCVNFAENDTFTGVQADAAKEFVGIAEIGVMDDILTVNSQVVAAQNDIMETFQTNVDAAANALIDEDTLNGINYDLKTFFTSHDSIGTQVEAIYSQLLSFSKYGVSFTEPDFDSGRAAFESICGGEGNGGYVEECRKKLIDFDDEATVYLRSLGLEKEIAGLSDRLRRSSSSMQRYQLTRSLPGNYRICTVGMGGNESWEHVFGSIRNSLNSLNAGDTIDYSVGGISDGSENDFFPTQERILSDAEKTLYDELGVAVKNYKLPFQDFKTVNKSNLYVMDYVLDNDESITRAAEKYGVKKEMVQAIIFQEVRFYGMEDGPKDLAVRFSHLMQNIVPDTVPLITDSSTGPGQIFAATAIDAYNWYKGDAVYDRQNRDDIRLMWNYLQDDENNIEMVALVLKYKESLVTDDADTDEIRMKNTLAAYNGSGDAARRYGEGTYNYAEAFKKYESNK